MTRKTKLFVRVPQALHIGVLGPRIDAVGRNVDNFVAAFTKDKENDKLDSQIPSMNGQLQ